MKNTEIKATVTKENICCSKALKHVLINNMRGLIGRIFTYFIIVYLLVVCVSGRALYIPNESKDLIQITISLLTLESCSADATIVDFRTLSITNGQGCPNGTFYLCGIDASKMFIIEDCQHVLECQPGTTHVFEVNPANRTFVLKCLPCADDWFEPEYSKSSRSSLLPGCTYKHKPAKNISDNLVLFEQGTKASATRWYCDIEKGYYEENGNLFCDDVPTTPCSCVHKRCEKGFLLRPDGRCVRCSGKLDPSKNFRCMHEDKLYRQNSALSTQLGTDRKFYPSESSQHNLSDDNADTAVHTSTSPNNNAENETADGGNIVIIVLGVVVPVIGLGLLHCCGWSRLVFKVSHLVVWTVDRCRKIFNTGHAGHRNMQTDNAHAANNAITDQYRNGGTTNGSTYNQCVVFNQYNQSGSSQTGNVTPEERAVPNIVTPKADDASSLETDHGSESFGLGPLDQRMNTLKSGHWTTREPDDQASKTKMDDEDKPLLPRPRTDSQTDVKQPYGKQ